MARAGAPAARDSAPWARTKLTEASVQSTVVPNPALAPERERVPRQQQREREGAMDEPAQLHPVLLHPARDREPKLSEQAREDRDAEDDEDELPPPARSEEAALDDDEHKGNRRRQPAEDERLEDVARDAAGGQRVRVTGQVGCDRWSSVDGRRRGGWGEVGLLRGH
jgi:hypothetical protein